MICKEYAHCTWTYYRTQMPSDEKRFWRHFVRAEWERGEMRKTEAYKAMHKDGTPPPVTEPTLVAPSVPIEHIDRIEDV